jgi:hypothetical protein
MMGGGEKKHILYHVEREIERDREVGRDGANGNSPCGEMRRMFTGEFSCCHGYRRDMSVMS